MSFVVAALVLLGALTMANLLLTLGVVRRLREHTKILDATTTGGAIAEFSATTVDGVPLTREGLAEGPEATTVAFLAPECGSCRSQVPALVEWASAQSRDRTLVVLDALVTDPADLVEALNPVARVIVEKSGLVAGAFQVSAFPSFCLVGDGRVVASFAEVSDLRAALRA